MDTATVPVALARLRRSERPIAEPVAKIGGAPVFVESADWPVCPACGRTMEFIAQLTLQEPLHLSRRFAMAYVFQCALAYPSLEDEGLGTCPGDPDLPIGPTAVLFQRATAPGFVARPVRPPPTSNLEYAMLFEPKEEPDVDLEVLSDDELNAVVEQIATGTRLGGVPVFIQGYPPVRPIRLADGEESDAVPYHIPYGWALPCPQCRTATQFIAQIDADLDQKGYPFGALLRFGDVGRAYLYLCSAECSPQGYIFWWDCS